MFKGQKKAGVFAARSQQARGKGTSSAVCSVLILSYLQQMESIQHVTGRGANLSESHDRQGENGF